jgi:hypothetical protein
MNTFWTGFCLFILPFLIVLVYETIKERMCATCRKVVLRGKPKVLDSYYGLQYICSESCWDGYRGWWCDTCALLHDHDTTMESNDSCI